MTTPTRTEIIQAYRTNIAQGKRSKLSKADRQNLIDYFIIDLKSCETEDDCRRRCQQEISLLEEGYPTASVAAQYLPQWRKAIEDAVEDGNLPHQELPLTEHGRRYPHWALFHLRYDNATYHSLSGSTTQANNWKQDNLAPVDPEQFVWIAKTCLLAEDYRTVVVGLLALTGRRFSEIIAKGEFAPTTHPYAIQFTGQLKKKSEEPETYTIATLAPAKKILQAIAQLRANPAIQQLQNLDPDDINSRVNTSIRARIKEHFEGGIIPILAREKSVSAHNLRGVYSAVAIHYWCPPNQAPHRFVQAHLGHVIGEAELERRKNSGATEHYFHYYLTQNGKPLSSRGVLLQKFPPLSEAMPLSGSDIAGDDSVQNPPPDAPTPNPLPTPTEDSAIAPLAQTISWLQAKLDEAHQEIRELRAQSPSLDAGELLRLQTENARLRSENQRLQTELRQFHQLKKIMGVPEAPNGHSPQSAPGQESSLNSRGRQSIAGDDNVQNQGGFGSAIPSAIAPTTPSTNATTTPTTTHPNTAENRAISAIIAYNNQPDLPHHDKWYISIPVLMDLIRARGLSTSQNPLRAALDSRREEIQQHHLHHQLGVRHNTKHTDEKITDFLQLEQ